MVRLRVSNLSPNTTEDELRHVFEDYGDMVTVDVVNDPDTGRSMGFAYVEMREDIDAKAAIDGLDGAELGGHLIEVEEATKVGMS